MQTLFDLFRPSFVITFIGVFVVLSAMASDDLNFEGSDFACSVQPKIDFLYLL